MNNSPHALKIGSADAAIRRSVGGITLDTPALRERLEERFSSIRFDQAKEDIRPYLKDPCETASLVR